jgi:hypothetical protein
VVSTSYVACYEAPLRDLTPRCRAPLSIDGEGAFPREQVGEPLENVE